jgi:hypothetical protein
VKNKAEPVVPPDRRNCQFTADGGVSGPDSRTWEAPHLADQGRGESQLPQTARCTHPVGLATVHQAPGGSSPIRKMDRILPSVSPSPRPSPSSLPPPLGVRSWYGFSSFAAEPPRRFLKPAHAPASRSTLPQPVLQINTIRQSIMTVCPTSVRSISATVDFS